MKLTASRLKQLIKEEIELILTEQKKPTRLPTWLSDMVSDAYAPGEELLAAFEPEGGVELSYRPGAYKDVDQEGGDAEAAATDAVSGEFTQTAQELPGASAKRAALKSLQKKGISLSRLGQKTLKAGGAIEGLLGLPYDVAAGISNFYDTMKDAGGLDKWDVESKVGVGKLKMDPAQAKRETQFWYTVGKRIGMDMDEPRTDVTQFQGRLYIAAGRGSRSTVRRIIGEMGLYNAREQLKLLKKQQQRNRGRLSKTGKLIKSEIENYLRDRTKR